MPWHLRADRDPVALEACSFRSLLQSAVLVFLAPGLMAPALAAPADELVALVALVNDYRNENRNCGKRRLQSAGPLAPHKGLSNLEIAGAGDLKAALRARDYTPAAVQVLQVSGFSDPQSAMNMLKKHYCEPLMNPQYVDIGVSHTGTSWRVVLARPVLSAALKDWPEEGREILKLTNEARAKDRPCGTKVFKAVKPVAWAPRLGAASLAHSRDMARQNYFSHRSKNGGQASDRVEEQDYAWRQVGENIAAGQGSAQQVVAAWLSSPPHCANLMGKDFSEMGAAYAIDRNSDALIYWTQVFATPR